MTTFATSDEFPLALILLFINYFSRTFKQGDFPPAGLVSKRSRITDGLWRPDGSDTHVGKVFDENEQKPRELLQHQHPREMQVSVHLTFGSRDPSDLEMWRLGRLGSSGVDLGMRA